MSGGKVVNELKLQNLWVQEDEGEKERKTVTEEAQEHMNL